MLKLNLRRFLFEDNTTLGMLYVNDVFECWTLEDIPRHEKIHGETCIPEEIYRIIIKRSPHFGRLMPYLVDVKNYTDVMIHWGLKIKDTLGCILVGGDLDSPSLLRNGTSKIAFDKLFVKIQRALDNKEDVFLSIETYVPPIPL
jgi:hypothetical protein